MAAQRVVRQLELVPLADEDSERPLAVARGRRRVGEAAAQEVDRRFELGLVVLLADGGGDQLGLDPDGPQLAFDALGAPAVEPPAVLREALGDGGVVDLAVLPQLAEEGVDHGGLDPLAGQQARDLGDRVVAPVERGPRDPERVLETHLGVG